MSTGSTQPASSHAPGPGSGPSSGPTWAAWATSWRATILLILGVLAVRILYLAFFCPYTLIEDEAHYWEWSRRLDLSYYTKGPGVAWAIAASTHLFGVSEFAIRLPAAISGAVLMTASALLAFDISKDRRAAFFAALAVLLVPMFQLIGLMMTIDGPYAACWSVATLGAWLALGRGRASGWLLFGLACGIGVLFKYTMLLLLPGVLVYALLFRRVIPTTRLWWPGLLAGLVLFCCAISPIIIWNAREGWPTIQHLLGHLGMKGGDMPVTQGDGHGWKWQAKWTLELVGTQIAMIGPLLFLGLRRAWKVWPLMQIRGVRWAGEMFLLLCSIPILLFYFGVSFIAEPEGNWPMAGFITLLPLAAFCVLDEMPTWVRALSNWRALPSPRPRAGFFVRRPESVVQVLWYASIVVGVAVALIVPRLDVVAKLPAVGRFVPIHRFTGADRMGAHAAKLLEQAKVAAAPGSNTEPFIVAMHYGRASQLAFYVPGRPIVYCSSSLMRDGRRTQYDFWSDTNLRQVGSVEPGRTSPLLGRPALAVGATATEWAHVFTRVAEAGTLDSDGKKDRPAFIAINFTGFTDERIPMPPLPDQPETKPPTNP